MRIVKKADFDRIGSDYKGVWQDYNGERPEWIGRRTAFLPGEGTTLFIEGVHFLVENDYSHLPTLTKENAKAGEYYRMASGCILVHRIYRLSEEEARAKDIVYLDRVETDIGDFAVAWSEMRSDLKYYHKLRGGKQ
jgi:hypothetical protein